MSLLEDEAAERLPAERNSTEGPGPVLQGSAASGIFRSAHVENAAAAGRYQESLTRGPAVDVGGLIRNDAR